MATTTQQTIGRSGGAWALARSQHGVVTRGQLLTLGLTPAGIKHRLARGRLHHVWRGVYAVGRPTLTRQGRWMAAVLACGGEGAAAISHSSAAAMLRIGPEQGTAIEVSRVEPTQLRAPGVRVHRRPSLGAGWFGYCDGIPVTSPVQTVIDLATRYEQRTVERMVNEADRLGLVKTDDLRNALDEHAGKEGVARLREIIDRRTFRYTRSELERAFLPLVREAGLPIPETSVFVNGYEVDFWLPDLRLVIETDGLTYHRTPSQQAKDLERDQDHGAAGLRCLRFTHAQIKYDPDRVLRLLRATASHKREPVIPT